VTDECSAVVKGHSFATGEYAFAQKAVHS